MPGARRASLTVKAPSQGPHIRSGPRSTQPITQLQLNLPSSTTAGSCPPDDVGVCALLWDIGSSMCHAVQGLRGSMRGSAYLAANCPCMQAHGSIPVNAGGGLALPGWHWRDGTGAWRGRSTRGAPPQKDAVGGRVGQQHPHAAGQHAGPAVFLRQAVGRLILPTYGHPALLAAREAMGQLPMKPDLQPLAQTGTLLQWCWQCPAVLPW